MIEKPTIPIGPGLVPIPLKNPSTKRERAKVITPLPAVLYSVWVDYNGTSGDVYLHVFEASEQPGNNLVPTLPPVPIPTPGAVGVFEILDCSPGCLMQGGIVVALSSTRDTLTLITSDDAKFNALFYPLV